MLTYKDVMAVMVEYLPEVGVAAADNFIQALLDYEEDQEVPKDTYLRLYEKESPGAAFQWLCEFAAHYEPVLVNGKDKKIMAIKELRMAAYCGLKEAKEAVESAVVQNAIAAHHFDTELEELKS